MTNLWDCSYWTPGHPVFEHYASPEFKAQRRKGQDAILTDWERWLVEHPGKAGEQDLERVAMLPPYGPKEVAASLQRMKETAESLIFKERERLWALEKETLLARFRCAPCSEGRHCVDCDCRLDHSGGRIGRDEAERIRRKLAACPAGPSCVDYDCRLDHRP